MREPQSQDEGRRRSWSRRRKLQINPVTLTRPWNIRTNIHPPPTHTLTPWWLHRSLVRTHCRHPSTATATTADTRGGGGGCRSCKRSCTGATISQTDIIKSNFSTCWCKLVLLVRKQINRGWNCSFYEFLGEGVFTLRSHFGFYPHSQFRFVQINNIANILWIFHTCKMVGSAPFHNWYGNWYTLRNTLNFTLIRKLMPHGISSFTNWRQMFMDSLKKLWKNVALKTAYI